MKNAPDLPAGPQPQPAAAVNLHIERIVLDGIDLPAHQHPVFQRAVLAELTRLFAEGGMRDGLSGGGMLRDVPAGQVEAAPSPDPAEFGRRVARAVYEGIGR